MQYSAALIVYYFSQKTKSEEEKVAKRKSPKLFPGDLGRGLASDKFS